MWDGACPAASRARAVAGLSCTAAAACWRSRRWRLPGRCCGWLFVAQPAQPMQLTNSAERRLVGCCHAPTVLSRNVRYITHLPCDCPIAMPVRRTAKTKRTRTVSSRYQSRPGGSLELATQAADNVVWQFLEPPFPFDTSQVIRVFAEAKFKLLLNLNLKLSLTLDEEDRYNLDLDFNKCSKNGVKIVLLLRSRRSLFCYGASSERKLLCIS
jgi:hypothetical protein